MKRQLFRQLHFNFPEVVAGLDPLVCDWTRARGRGYPSSK